MQNGNESINMTYFHFETDTQNDFYRKSLNDELYLVNRFENPQTHAHRSVTCGPTGGKFSLGLAFFVGSFGSKVVLRHDLVL